MSSLYIDKAFRISQEILELRHRVASIKVKSRASARLFTLNTDSSSAHCNH